jgi:hypothetical protein
MKRDRLQLNRAEIAEDGPNISGNSKQNHAFQTEKPGKSYFKE